MEVHAFLLCDRAPRDEHGKWMLLGVFDRIRCPVFPAIYPEMAAYYRVSMPEKVGQVVEIALQFTGPDGIAQATPVVEVTPQEQAYGVSYGSITIQGFGFPSAGAYVFELLLDGLSVSRYTIYVVGSTPEGEVSGTVH